MRKSLTASAILVMVAAWITAVFGAQPAAAVEQAVDAYVVTTSDDPGGPAFNPGAGSVTILEDSDDGEVQNVPLGFTFEYFGDLYSQATIGVNGGIQFDDPSVSFVNQSLAANNKIGIYPLWDDWDTRSQAPSRVRYGTTGPAGERVFVVVWEQTAHFPASTNAGDNVTFQLQLREADNSVEFHYTDARTVDSAFTRGASATVGIDGPGDRFVQYSFNEQAVDNNLAIRFEPQYCDGRLATHVGTNGDDTITGTPGNDVVVARGGNDTIDTGDGDDLVCAGEGLDDVSTGAGADVVHGEEGSDDIDTGSEDDTVYGGPGRDNVRAGEGADYVDGNGGHDVVSGDGGDDTLLGKGGRDTIRGGSGNDTINGHRDNDTLDGGDGDDLVIGGKDRDEVRGGPGADRVAGERDADDVRGGSGPDVVIGGIGNDTLYGDEDDDRIIGGPGNDDLFGNDGDDTLGGNAGDDHLDGGDGPDTCAGGSGNDQAVNCSTSFGVRR